MSLRWLLPLLGMLLLVPSAGWAQSQQCTEYFLQGDRFSSYEAGGDTMIIMHNAFTVTCNDGMELRADSGQANRTTGELELVGNVYFNDAAQTLTADSANYSRAIDRLYASGNVNLVNRTEGSTLTGPEVEYFRANEEREESLVYATQRPTLILEPRDSADNARGSEPLTLIGDRVNIVGNDDLTAVGSVIITQEDLTAQGEEVYYDAANETLELRQNANVVREGSSISGEVVQAQLVEGALQHVQSRTNARLEGEDLTVEAADIQLFFDRDTLQQVIARVPPNVAGERARAASQTFRTEADSIDARFVAGALDAVYAIGAALGETIDTTQAGAQSLEMVTRLDAIELPPDSIGEVAVAVASVAASPEEEASPAAAGESPIEPADSLGDEAVEGGEAPPSPESIAALTASDWIRGDTIIALFAPADSAAGSIAEDSTVVADPEEVEGAEIESTEGVEVEPESAEAIIEGVEVEPEAECLTEPCPEEEPAAQDAPELRKLIARRGAQSFYRLAPENPAAPDCRNLSFLVGAEIELDVVEGELEVANVRGLEQGFYLEANSCAPAVPAEEVPAGNGELPGEDEAISGEGGELPSEGGGTPDDGRTPDPSEIPPALDTAMIHGRD